MPSELIKNRLEELRSQKTFDDGFIDILLTSNKEGEDGDATVLKILQLVKERYAQSKENKT
ncbi:MAG: hypothetical protein M1383_05870 [Patescibacteria group bacterium]|nr:hypothetical protein [Patescibacteria group bacterium]